MKEEEEEKKKEEEEKEKKHDLRQWCLYSDPIPGLLCTFVICLRVGGSYLREYCVNIVTTNHL